MDTKNTLFRKMSFELFAIIVSVSLSSSVAIVVFNGVGWIDTVECIRFAT